jgi:hypothetical protein
MWSVLESWGLKFYDPFNFTMTHRFNDVILMLLKKKLKYPKLNNIRWLRNNEEYA